MEALREVVAAEVDLRREEKINIDLNIISYPDRLTRFIGIFYVSKVLIIKMNIILKGS